MNEYRYIRLEEENSKLQNDVKQLTDDNKLMWDLWKQVQASKPDITDMIAKVVEKEACKFAVKEQQLWGLIEERDVTISQLEKELDSKTSEQQNLSEKFLENRATEATLQSKLAESDIIEEKLKDEIERLSNQIIDSDGVNNRLLASLEKEIDELKQENDALRRRLVVEEDNLIQVQTNVETANNSSTKLMSEINSYRQMMNISEAELEKIKTTCDELQCAVSKKNVELDSLRYSNCKLADDLNQQLHEKQKLKAQVDELLSRTMLLESEIVNVKQVKVDQCNRATSEAFDDVEQVLDENKELRVRLAHLTEAYNAKCLENDMIHKRLDSKMDALEQLHSEQRAIKTGLDGLDIKLHQDPEAAKEFESSLESERLIALLKQHCRELANDRDMYAGRLEKALVDVAKTDSNAADLKLRLLNTKRDEEVYARKLNLEHEKKLADVSKQVSGKLNIELNKLKSENLKLKSQVDNFGTEKRRLRAQLSACQTRLNKEASLRAGQHDRIVELEENSIAATARITSLRSQLVNLQKGDGKLSERRRRTRSVSFCSQSDSPVASLKKTLTFDMSTQTDPIKEGSSPSPLPSSRGCRRPVSTARQQLGMERMRIARLLRVAADLKTDRMKLRRQLENEQNERNKIETEICVLNEKLSSAIMEAQLLESKLVDRDAELAHTKKRYIDIQQKYSEASVISPRADKSVITEPFDDIDEYSNHVSLEAFQKVQERLAVVMMTEREQNSRLAHYQVECDRLTADLTLAKERLNDVKREYTRDRRLYDEQREKLRSLDSQVTSDAIRIKDLTDRLVNAEKVDRSVHSRVSSLKRRVDELEAEKTSHQRRLDEKIRENDRLSEQLKKSKTRCQYLEVTVSTEKSSYSRSEAQLKEDLKKLQTDSASRQCKIDEFRTFVELLADALVERFSLDRNSVNSCEMSGHHRKTAIQDSDQRSGSQMSTDSSLASRAATLAQAHLKLTAEEAAELLFTGSTDSTSTSSVSNEHPHTFHRKISSLVRQILHHSEHSQFAHRLCQVFFNGLADHFKYLLSRPQCCLKIISNRDEQRMNSDEKAFHHPRPPYSSMLGCLSDSIFSGSPF